MKNKNEHGVLAQEQQQQPQQLQQQQQQQQTILAKCTYIPHTSRGPHVLMVVASTSP